MGPKIQQRNNQGNLESSYPMVSNQAPAATGAVPLMLWARVSSGSTTSVGPRQWSKLAKPTADRKDHGAKKVRWSWSDGVELAGQMEWSFLFVFFLPPRRAKEPLRLVFKISYLKW